MKAGLGSGVAGVQELANYPSLAQWLLVVGISQDTREAITNRQALNRIMSISNP